MKLHINKTNNFENTIRIKNGSCSEKTRKTLKKMPYILCFQKKCVPLQSILDNGDRKLTTKKDKKNAYYSTVSS